MRQCSNILLGLFLLVILSSCGGGGGGTKPDMAAPMSTPTRPSGDDSTTMPFMSIISELEQAQSPAAQAQIADAARQMPYPGMGSILQESFNSSINEFSAEVGYRNGNLTFRSSIAEGNEEVALISDDAVVRTQTNGEGWTHLALHDTTTVVEGEDEGLDFNVDGDVYTDSEGSGDTDYLVGGVWLVPGSEDREGNPNPWDLVAFMDGSDPFMQDNLAGLTGTATYEGDAFGVYADMGEGDNKHFEADVELTAEFGGGATLGTISGSVSEFELDGERTEEIGVLTLGETSIGDSSSGFFTGDTSLDGGFTGKWGGLFYGNGESDGKPGSVAGTFGAATDDESRSLLGIFGTYKQ